MKRNLLSVLLVAAMVLSMLSGCGNTAGSTLDAAASEEGTALSLIHIWGRYRPDAEDGQPRHSTA